MWWFLNKSKHQAKADFASQSKTVSVQSLAEDGLLAQVPDLTALGGHDIAVKIWLPQDVAQVIKWMADYEGMSQSQWVRARLVAYLYGSVAQLAQKIRHERASECNSIMFSRAVVDRGAGRWVYKVPQLGKNTVAFKLWLSQQLRDDLALLAKHAGLALSPFIREAVIGELYGRGSLPERPEIMGEPTAGGLAWERGEAVPELEVEEGDFNQLGEAVRVWVNAKEADKPGGP